MKEKSKVKRRRVSEFMSVFVAKRPAAVVLLAILVFNICFLFISALIISNLAPSTLADSGFWASVFYTITMILDAGCIQFVVSDVGAVGTGIIVTCLIIIIIGMISFSGAVIGYITNYITGFIEASNSGTKRLVISNHTIILNWNSRASEIVNEFLYSPEAEKVVVLSSEDKDVIEREIVNRLSDTITKEKSRLMAQAANMNWFKRFWFIRRNRFRNRTTVIVRQGEVYSSKQLEDISIEKAKAVIILSQDVARTVCKYDFSERIENHGKGNSGTIKTLIQVAEMTSAESSNDNQHIIVEVDDDWTLDLVNQIIRHKEKIEKCNITPLKINKILGQILSQFTVMPELSLVYDELFSNNGAFICSRSVDGELDDNGFVNSWLEKNDAVIPLTVMDTKSGRDGFFVANSENLLKRSASCPKTDLKVSVNENFWFKTKNIVILGHNSGIRSIMDGFNSFRNEWNRKKNGKGGEYEDILNIMIIDDKESLEKNNFYRDYPYVTNVVDLDIYDKQGIYNTVYNFTKSHSGDTSVLILSDDYATAEDVDSKALSYLVYMHELILDCEKNDADYYQGKIDIIVEVLNPKNADVVKNYSVNNVIISNRYISRMMAQIGEHDSIYEFYNDILTYDSADCKEYDSKEIYIKSVSEFFNELPPRCSAYDLIRAVYECSSESDRVILLGYVRNEKDMQIFCGEQEKIQIQLRPDDKLIVFCKH